MKGDTLKYSLPGICDGHILGLREWQICPLEGNPGTYGLFSATANHMWRPAHAMCAPVPLTPEGYWNTEGSDLPRLGVHAYSLRAPALSILSKPERLVIGIVALWGEIIEHERGYRAQYAYPVYFHPPEWLSYYSHTTHEVRKLKQTLAAFKPILNGEDHEQYWCSDETLYRGASRCSSDNAVSATYAIAHTIAKAERYSHTIVTETSSSAQEGPYQRACLAFSNIPDPRWITNRNAWSPNAYE